MTNYKIDVLTYNKNGSVKSDCADITFQNNGSLPVVLNGGFTIPSGGMLMLSANAGEIDRTIYTFYFEGATSTAGCVLVVLRKVYI